MSRTARDRLASIGVIEWLRMISRAPWRVGDQRHYVSDTCALTAATGWAPRTDVAEGVSRLHRWLHAQRSEGVATGARSHAA